MYMAVFDASPAAQSLRIHHHINITYHKQEPRPIVASAAESLAGTDLLNVLETARLRASRWGSAYDGKPWPMPPACSAGDHSPTQLIAEHQQRATRAQALILARPTGGLGNMLDTVLHAFLRAYITGKRLLVAETSPALKYLAKTPLWTLVDSEAVSLLSKANVSVESVQSENWLPFSSHDLGLWKRLWGNTHSVSALVSCSSHALFQPNRSVAASMAPYLQELERSRNSIGVHTRSSDKEMAQRQAILPIHHGRGLQLAMRPRPGCTLGDSLTSRLVDCAKPHRGNLTYFIASDSVARFRSLQKAVQEMVPTARVLTSSGEPYHTGRPVNAPPKDGSDPILKALVDFFIMERVERFFANCDFLACFKRVHASLWGSPSDQSGLVSGRGGEKCGNTFAGNIWIRRAVLDARSPSLGSCQVQSDERDRSHSHSPGVSQPVQLPGEVSQGSRHQSRKCVEVGLEKQRAHHKAFDPLDKLSQPPSFCGLSTYPELVKGAKQGDDDKRLCSMMVHGLRPDDVIVSIGSNNEFGFEEQMLACTTSHIATFDCTVANATNKPDNSRVSFHPYCIGPADTEHARTWTSISELALRAARLHSGAVDIDQARPPPRIAILKMDVEGWEWVVLEQVTRAASVRSSLPQQIAVEVHLKTHASMGVPGFNKGDLPSKGLKLRQLRERMTLAGYALIDRNDNPWCGHCSELLFVLHE